MGWTAAAIIGSAVLGAAGSAQAAGAAKRAGAVNAAQSRKLAAERERVSRRQSSALMARQRVATASQGTSTEGSPLLIMEDTAREAEKEALFIREGGEAQAVGYMADASARATSAYYGAASTLIGGIGDALSLKSG